MKVARFLIASSAIFSGAVIGHALGDGTFAVGNSHFLFLLLIALASLFLARNSLEGPKLAMVIALAQFGTHFFFSTSGASEIQMALSHIILGIVTYQLIARMDLLVEIFFKLLDRLILFRFLIIKPNWISPLLTLSQARFFVYLQISRDIARRGPPVIAI
ncbi:MAG: hypothetical protein ACKN90_00385 [Candidatus Nanopelagicaceae bacterium]